MGPIISRLPISVRVERSRDTVRSRTTDGHLDFARSARGLVTFTESPNSAGPITSIRPADRLRQIHRSEEHTSELQSLMRISYAVFCLKKKNHVTHNHHTQPILLPAIHDTHAYHTLSR